jgi:hypothetical protein
MKKANKQKEFVVLKEIKCPPVMSVPIKPAMGPTIQVGVSVTIMTDKLPIPIIHPFG